MKTASLALCLALAPAHAAILGYVVTPQGRIELHTTRGAVCVGDAYHAEFVSAQGQRVAGCWVSRGDIAAVVFFDGDVARVPVMYLLKPAPT